MSRYLWPSLSSTTFVSSSVCQPLSNVVKWYTVLLKVLQNRHSCSPLNTDYQIEGVFGLLAGDSESERETERGDQLRDHSNCWTNLCLFWEQKQPVGHPVDYRFLIGQLARAPSVCCRKSGGLGWSWYQKWSSWCLFTASSRGPCWCVFVFVWVCVCECRDPPLCEGHATSLSMSAGLIPKKGRMAMPGTISASGSEGLGEIQIPPVSGRPEKYTWFSSGKWSLMLFFFSISFQRWIDEGRCWGDTWSDSMTFLSRAA